MRWVRSADRAFSSSSSSLDMARLSSTLFFDTLMAFCRNTVMVGFWRLEKSLWRMHRTGVMDKNTASQAISQERIMQVSKQESAKNMIL
jgi:hypothetical protein